MATEKRSDFSNALPPLGEVLCIQSFMPTGDHIRKSSVLEIEVPNDLHSTKLGIVAWESSCQTCDCFLEKCPGHSGHLEMPIPTYRIFFVKRLLNILNCICFYCQKLRLPKSDPNYRWIQGLETKHRITYLLKYGYAYKRCGECLNSNKRTGKSTDDSALALSVNMDEEDIGGELHIDSMPSAQITGRCGKLFINFQNEDRDAAFIKAVVPLDAADHQAFTEDPEWQPFQISPSDVFACLYNISPETKEMLGCDEWNEPHASMWDVLPIPSHNTRPCHTFSGIGTSKKRVYNDWTKLLRNIVSARNDLEKAIQTSTETINICTYELNDIVSRNVHNCFRYGYLEKAKRDVVKKRLKDDYKKMVFGAVEGLWRQLNKQIAAFHSFRHKKYANKGSSYGKPLINVEERYKYQKAGRFRGNIIARRVNNAMRGVLEGDIYLRPDQVGVPKQEAMALSLKVYVNRLNMKHVHTWITNGPYVYPGANYLMMLDGTEINLAFYENRRDIVIKDILYIRRHILDGDLVMVNRQPTLHRPSMMTFKVVVIDGYAIRLHYSVFTPMAADCDGDEVNIHVPQTMQAIAELLVISGVDRCIMKDGKVWIKFIQNASLGAYLMSRPELLLSEAEVHDITSFLDLWEYPDPVQTSPVKKWTGHSIISLLFPHDFTMQRCATSKQIDKEILIVNGQLIRGQLTEDVLNGSGGILEHLYRDYPDREVTIRFLHQGYLMFQNYLDIHGMSAGYFDCAIDYHDIDRHKTRAGNPFVMEAMDKMALVRSNIEKLHTYADTFPTHNPKYGKVEIETNLKQHIEQINKTMCDAVNDYHIQLDKNKYSNGVLQAILSGTKGSPNVLNQMCGVVSQVYVMYQRYENCSSHYRLGKDTMQAFGFVTQNYSTGIGLKGVISEAPATCESVVNKNKGTGRSGYTMRKITTCMMGVVIDHKGRALDTNGRVIWNIYGNDGYDPTTMTNSKLRLLVMSEWSIPKRYGVYTDLSSVLKVSSAHTKAEWIKLTQCEPCAIDQEWFDSLGSFQDDQGHTISDRSADVEVCMTAEVLTVWKAIRRRSETVFLLTEEITNLVLLRNQLQELMVQSSESFDTSVTRCPFHFHHLFRRCAARFSTGQDGKVDMTPLDYRKFTKQLWDRLILERLVVVTNLTLKSLFFDWMSTRSLMLRWRFGLREILWISKEIIGILARSRIQAGESVGINATQSLGEPFTQMTLKTPHLSGKFPTVVAGTVRIASVVDGNFNNSTMTVVLQPHITTKREADMIGLSLSSSYLIDISSSYPTYTIYEFEENKKKCLIRIEIDRARAIERIISIRTVVKNLCQSAGLELEYFKTSFSTDDTWHIYIDIPFSSVLWQAVVKVLSPKMDHDNIVADNIVFNLYRSVVIHGAPKIKNFIVETMNINTLSGKSKRWSIVTLGSDLSHVLRVPGVDTMRTVSNDCSEMCSVLGIHAARKSLENEFLAVMSGMADDRHIKLIARMMASDLIIKGMKIKQVGQNIPPLQRAAYEQGPKQMMAYCALGERDYAQTICGAALTNKLMNIGTGYNLDLVEVQNVVQPLAARRSMSTLPHRMCDYVFSPKVDGLRLLFTLFHDRSDRKICNLTNRNFEVFSIPSSGIFPESVFSGTVLDGDLVQVPGTNRFCFVVFDCLVSCGNKTSTLRYDQRIEIARELVYRIGTNDLSTNISDAPEFSPVDLGLESVYALPVSARPIVSQAMFTPGSLPFSITVKPVFSLHGIAHFTNTRINSLTFPTDGHVITSLRSPAYPFRMKNDSVFKHKPRGTLYNENTIDVVITSHIPTNENHDDHQIHLPDLAPHCSGGNMPPELDSYRTTDGEYIMWGNDKNGRPMLFSHAQQSVVDVEEGDVYECRWNHQTHLWEIFRKRDKSANAIHTIVATIRNIVENISLDELTVVV